MDDVEKRVQLPEGARHLDEYGRYYAYQEGKVLGRYVIPMTEAPGQTCEELAADFTSHPAECPPMRKDMPAGQRRWLENYRELPGISDGGCQVVDVLFNPATQKVEEVECNGEA